MCYACASAATGKEVVTKIAFRKMLGWKLQRRLKKQLAWIILAITYVRCFVHPERCCTRRGAAASHLRSTRGACSPESAPRKFAPIGALQEPTAVPAEKRGASSITSCGTPYFEIGAPPILKQGQKIFLRIRASSYFRKKYLRKQRCSSIFAKMICENRGAPLFSQKK